jgi:Cu-Zn family superoxide dismutase
MALSLAGNHIMKTHFALAAIASCALAWSGAALAKTVTVDINKISESGVGEKIGEASLSETDKGLTLKLAVAGIPAGEHGFHVHEKGDCGPGMKDGKPGAGLAAGAHFDPEGSKTHAGPHGAGHKGDLPKLSATADGIDQTVALDRLKLSDVAGRALVIHEAGDNYSDTPENGGGKGRIACGVIPK